MNGNGCGSRVARREDGKVIAGVCAGVAHQFGLDPTVVRLVAVVAVVCGAGVLIPAYLVAAFVMPTRDPTRGDTALDDELDDDPSLDLGWRSGHRTARRRDLQTPTRALGWLLIAAGAFALVDRLGWFDWKLLAAAGLVVVGVNLLVRDRLARD